MPACETAGKRISKKAFSYIDNVNVSFYISLYYFQTLWYNRQEILFYEVNKLWYTTIFLKQSDTHP